MCFQIAGLLLVLHSLATVQCAKSRFELDINKFTCSNHSAHITRLNCDYMKLATSHFVFNGEFMLDHDFGPDSEGHLIIQLTPPTGGISVTFVDLKIGVCEGLTSMFSNPLLTNLMAEGRRVSNLPKSCPFKKNVLYKANNFTATAALIPLLAPYTNFSGSVRIYQNKKLYSSGLVKGSILPGS